MHQPWRATRNTAFNMANPIPMEVNSLSKTFGVRNFTTTFHSINWLKNAGPHMPMRFIQSDIVNKMLAGEPPRRS